MTRERKRWEMLNSIWIAGIILTIGLFNWVSFLYIGIRVKQRKWIYAGIGYAVPFVIYMFSYESSSLPSLDDWASAVGTALWPVSIVHAFIVRREYLERLWYVKKAEVHELEKMREQIRREYGGTAGQTGHVRPSSSHVAANESVVSPSFGHRSQPSVIDLNRASEEEPAGNLVLKQQLTPRQLQLLQYEMDRRKKSKGVAYLLWFFLGSFGAHRFYVGDVGMGIGMALTLGGLGFWTLIDVFFIGFRVEEKNLELEREIIEQVKLMAPAGRPSSERPPSSPSGARSISRNSPLIDLNRASEEELASLPGMNLILAKNAIKKRSEKGGFSSVEDFAHALGLKPHVTERIRPRVTVRPLPNSSGPDEIFPGGKGRIVDF